MTQVGAGKYTYELIRDFPKLPKGESFGVISRVATDSQDRLYVFQRKDPPVMVFGRDGKYLGCWGIGAVKEAHGMKIVDDVVYTTDRPDSVAVAFTLDGRPLLVLGKRGVHSDTGCEKSPYIVLRAAGPFNHPTEMMPHPNGDIYVTDGYRNCRVHRFTRDGQLVKSWGTPGKTEGTFHLPHSLAIDPDGKLYVADRSNKRVQIFSPDGDFRHVDRDGRAERYYARQRRYLLHCRAGRRRQARVYLRTRCERTGNRPLGEPSYPRRRRGLAWRHLRRVDRGP